MPEAPRVTILMPTYNCETYVGDAVQSILDQTYRSLELLVVDDGSTDGTAAVLDRFTDRRIRVIRNEKNLGLPATRNLGLERARGEFLAFLDADDVARPERIERQVAFLDSHRDHAAVGSWALRVGDDPKKRVLRRPLSWARLRARIPFIGVLRTPSVTARLDVLRRFGFRAEFPVCEDSDLWARLALEERCANLPETLIEYRQHAGNTTKLRSRQVRERKEAIAAEQLERLRIEASPEDLRRHFSLRRPRKTQIDAELMDWASDWLRRLLQANQRERVYPEWHFRLAVGERWYLLWHSALRNGSYRRPPHRDPVLLAAAVSHLALERGALGLRYGSGLV